MKESIISKKEQEEIQYKAALKTIKSDQKLTNHSKLCENLLKKLVLEQSSNPDAPHMKFRVRASIYLDYMIHFLKRKGKFNKEKVE